MTIVLKRASRLPFAPIVAALFAVAAAVLVMAAPVWILERGVNQIGLSSILPAAAPPLGLKARALLALIALFGTGVVSWALAMPVSRLLSRPKLRRGFDVQPVKADAPEDMRDYAAPSVSRAPIFADRDLGAPFMSDEALALSPVAPAQPEVSYPANVSAGPVVEEEAPLTLDMSYLADGLPFGSAKPVEAEPTQADAPVAPYAPFSPYGETRTQVEDDFGGFPGLELETEYNDDDAAELPVLEPLAYSEPSYDAVPETVVATPAAIPVAPPASDAQETIAELIERLEKGLDQLSQHTAKAMQSHSAPVATPIALREALGRLERLAAANR
jgi:hypothetical protein